MNSNELSDHRSRSSSSSSCSELSNCGCPKASAQYRHQMQGGINSGHQGHRQPSQTAQNNQPSDNSVLNSDVTSSSGRCNVSISPNTLDAHKSNTEANQVIASVNGSTSHKFSSSFPTSQSCNAITSTACSSNDRSCNSPSSFLSSSLTSLSIQQKQQIKQSIHLQCAHSSESNCIQSIVPPASSSIRSSVHSSTPSVSLDHLSQVLHQPSFQSFSSSPSLVQSQCSISASGINNTTSCQFISSNLSNSYPTVTSSLATVVTTAPTTISSTSDNVTTCTSACASAHRTQVKEAITTSSRINSTTSGVDVVAMSGQSNGSESCISSVNGGRNIASVDCAITKNHSDSTVSVFVMPLCPCILTVVSFFPLSLFLPIYINTKAICFIYFFTAKECSASISCIIREAREYRFWCDCFSSFSRL